MIMGGDKKKMATIIVEKFGKPKDEKAKESNAMAFDKMAAEPEAEVDEGLLSGAEEVMAAFNSKSASKLAMALKDFFQLCDAAPHEEYEEEEKEQPILG